MSDTTASATIGTDALIIGAGPCGLFQVFELGLLGIKAHIVDSLAVPGGQCTELYPDKPIYDIPALPVCGAQELVDRLLEQIKPFGAEMHLGQEVTELTVRDDRRFTVKTSKGTEFDAGAVVIAAGLGSFQPRRFGAPGAEAFEGERIHYRIRRASDFHGKRLAIFGGGDSALDWTLDFLESAASVTLVHRRSEFRAAPASVQRMHSAVAAGRMRFVQGIAQSVTQLGNGALSVAIKAGDGGCQEIEVDHCLVFFGLHPKLGPIADWGLALEKKALIVDTEKFATSVPGIFAVGDINTYPGKKKLILSGFHEAALAAFAVQSHLFPGKKQFLQYTTTSPIMQKRLGVSAEEPQ
ncbi:MAG: NAD(P)/FAD-dependent oxidoreductase [Steroidobacteraceae bacterium]